MTPIARLALVPSFVVLIALVLLPACGSDAPQAPTDPTEPERIVLDTAEADIGQALVLGDVELPDDPEVELVVEVGGVRSLLLTNDAGDLRVPVPLFLEPGDTTSSADSSVAPRLAPPADPVAITIHDADGRLLATSGATLTVTAPAPAPGAATALLDGLDGWIAAVQELLDTIPMEPGWEDAHRHTLGPGLRALVAGDPQGGASELPSLLDRLEDLSPGELDLLESLWAGSGALEELQAMTAAVQETAARLRAARSGAEARVADPRDPVHEALARRATFEMDDTDLARLMQAGLLVQRYGQWYVKGAARDTGLVATRASIYSMFLFLAGSAPGASSIFGALNFVVSLVDFVINDHLLALFPTRVEALDLVLEEDVLAPGETTVSTLRLRATNEPPTVTLNDYIGQLINAMAIAAPAGQSAMRQFLQGYVSTLLGTINSLLVTYAGVNPGAPDTVELYAIPDMGWATTIDDDRLVELRSTDAALVQPLDEQIEWRALDGVGDALVSASVSRGEEAQLFPFPPFLEFQAGAFGEDVATSPRQRVEVRGNLSVEVDFAGTIDAQGANALAVHVGYVDSSGAVVPEEGALVELVASGGTVDQASGSTDATGQFVTVARLAPTSDEIVVTVTVTGRFGEQVTREVRAIAQGDIEGTWVGNGVYYDRDAEPYDEPYLELRIVRENGALRVFLYETPAPNFDCESTRGARYAYEITSEGGGEFIGSGSRYRSTSNGCTVDENNDDLDIALSLTGGVLEGTADWEEYPGPTYWDFRLEKLE